MTSLWGSSKGHELEEAGGKKTVVIADFAFTFGGCWLIKQLFLSHRKPCFKEEDSVIRITHDLIQVSSKQRGCESLENLKSTNLCWQSCSWRVHRQPCCFISIRNLFLSEKNVIRPPITPSFKRAASAVDDPNQALTFTPRHHPAKRRLDLYFELFENKRVFANLNLRDPK